MDMDREERLRVGVIFGGRSGEHEVSLMSAASVLSVLDEHKYEVIQVGVSHDGVWLFGENVLEALTSGDIERLDVVTILPDPVNRGLYRFISGKNSLKTDPFELISDLDIIFPVLHGSFGEDGTLQGLLEMADVTYVGAGVLGSAVGMDKALFRDVMLANNIPVVNSILILRGNIEADIDDVISQAESMSNYPLFVKPANLGSSVGVTKCHTRSDLIEGLMEAAQFDRRMLVQKAINAREIEVSVLGNDSPIASIPGEIIPSREFYSYEAKYLDGESELLIPAPIDEETANFARDLALKAYKAIDCSGMARVDFFLDKVTGELFVNELNTIPGFTKISMYPKLWNASGISYPELINRLIELALERKSDRDRTLRRYTVA
jgi:D-alanine-D-alanine ligase